MFCATLYCTGPDPVPDVPPVTVSQSTLDAAVHTQVDAEAVTMTLPVLPVAATDSDPGAIENMHGGGGGAACDTVKVWPAMAIVPVRAAPALASTLNATTPLPLPEAPPITINHDALDAAVHAHVASEAVTLTDPDVAVSATLCAGGAIENVQGGGGGGGGGGAAACDTVSVCPAIVIVPTRAAAGFGATVNPTTPLPVPVAPLVSDSHGAFELAVQVQLAAEAVTATDPGPPTSRTSRVVGAIVNVHTGGGGGGGGGAPACATVNVFPAAAIVALRALVAGLAATVNETLPFPVPEVGPLRVIHGALVVAVHAQLLADAVIAIELGPPASVTFSDVGEIENEHAGGGAAACAIVNVLPAAVMVAFRAPPLLAETR
jgi:hypothetical protein